MMMWNVYIYSTWVFAILSLVESVVGSFLSPSIKWRIFWAVCCFFYFLWLAAFGPWVVNISWPGDQSCAIVIGLASIIYFLSIIKDWPEKQVKAPDERSVALVEKQKKEY